MTRGFRAVLAGVVLGTCGGVLSQLGCMSAEERRALSVADCVARMALALPQRQLPRTPTEVTSDDLALAAQVVDGVWLCRHAGGELFTSEDPFAADGGA